MMKRFLFVLLVLLLSACQTDGLDMPAASDDVTLLGFADIRMTPDAVTSEVITSQALVNGISFEVLGRSVIDVDGERYMTLTLEVINGSNQDLDNLSLFALARDYTVAGTALTNVRDAAGNPISNPDVVRSVRPSHTVTLRNGQTQIVASEADFQGYLPTEVAQVQADADAVADDITVLNYGYAVRNTNDTRAIPAGASGIVSFTVRFPFDPDSPLGSPFRFSMPVAFVDMPQTRFTRGWDESNQDFTARVQSYYAPNAVPQDTELLLIGEPSTPLTIGTTLTVDVLTLFTGTATPLPTLEDAIGRIKRVDQENRVLAAAFVDEDNRGRRLRIVPQGDTQYFIESQAVTAEEFWQDGVLAHNSVIVTGSQINDVVVEAQEMTLSRAYIYRDVNRGFNASNTNIDVRSSSDVLVDITTCTGDTDTLGEVDQGRVDDTFYIKSIAIREFAFPSIPFCTPRSFLIPLSIDAPLTSGEYMLTMGTGQFAEVFTFEIP
jgi:hypothetical protein